MKSPIPAAALAQHMAILGKTGAGKTSVAKLAIEQVVSEGSRVCVLDPIKSDWWGLTSSADGRRPGLPFQILGGPRAHLPLHSSAGKAIGGVIASGALPLSIIDMAEFEPGGQQRFFTDFARILIQKMRGVVYLVLEEAHLFAPKERSGMGGENMAIHYAKLIATAGRTKGIRLMVLTQRTQALHNAILGSCETMIALRMTVPADQEPVVKWLNANVSDKATRAKIAGSLGSIATGDGWICSGEAKIFELAHFPRPWTYDNTKTPDDDDEEHQVKTAQVDPEKLRSLIGDALKEAEANDPKLLRLRIAHLEKQLVRGDGQITDNDVKTAVNAAHESGYDEGRAYGHAAGVNEERTRLTGLSLRLAAAVKAEVDEFLSNAPAAPIVTGDRKPPIRVEARVPEKSPRGTGQSNGHHNNRSGSVDKALPRAFLTALAQHPQGLTKGQILVHTGYRASGTVSTCFAELLRNDWISAKGNQLAITDTGIEALGDYEPLPTGKALRDHLLQGGKASTLEKAILRVLFDEYPSAIAKGDVLERTNYKASGTVSTAFARLVTLGYAVKAERSSLRASPELFA